MHIENPLAFSFIMQEDIFLLPNDKVTYNNPPAIAVESVELPVTETLPLSFNYLGKHKKNFLIITHYADADFIAAGHLTALENTLKRLEFSLDDTAILNRAKHAEATIEQLTDFFSPQKLLILGQYAMPAGLNNVNLNKLQQINSCRTLFTFSFDEMMDNNDHKKTFWEQMKQL
ncbi:hypothetical protein HDF24_01320 [Mucilaginibacter sp. X4EP1]|uniref:hypothetical protein n=1 Tax=Mucilaginibacter sp. X4EP1 TaxID=2723092 RepID=UPI00216A6028|nr:hypothetical protein [Mucilaginibacter sp. X4EP1]MCS3811656.1 hypothetical protein [Mucilaginibacter sp. X4EP1]